MQSVLSGIMAVFGMSVAAWPSQLYLATDLGSDVTAYAINNSGDVVGGANSRAFLYHNGSLNIIDPGPSVATGINNSGQVVGYDSNAAFLYSSGALTALPLPSPGGLSPSAAPIRINSSGDIAANVSGAYCGGPTPKSVIYRNGIATCLNVGPGFIAAKGINDSGVVVGIMFDFWPFINADGGLNMQIPGFFDGSANAINNSVQVVGSGAWVIAGSSGRGAFLYSDGVVTDLNALGGFTSSSANAINLAGVVVGTGDGFAFLYADGAFANLNALLANDVGTSLTSATGINDSGQIIASGANGHGFLLTPAAASVPEPASGVLFALGILLLAVTSQSGAAFRWRRSSIEDC